jgi:hypothetical protein
MSVVVKVLPVVTCQRIDAEGDSCGEAALGGTHTCYWHSGMQGSVMHARRDQSIWQEVAPGQFRRKTLYPRDYDFE